MGETVVPDDFTQRWINYRTGGYDLLPVTQPFRDGTATDYIPQDEETQRDYQMRRLAGESMIAALRGALRAHNDRKWYGPKAH